MTCRGITVRRRNANFLERGRKVTAFAGAECYKNDVAALSAATIRARGGARQLGRNPMKKLLLGAGAVVAFAAIGPAMAADLPARPVYKAPMVAPAVFSWTGCYIGGNIGGKWPRTSGSVNIPAATGPGGTSPASVFVFDDSSSSNGTFIGGGQVGCNYQTGPFVIGIEGDVDWQRWNRTATVGTVLVPPLFVTGDSFSLSSRWQASLRGRLGYAWDRFLLYVTGGAAWTDVTVGANFIPVTIGGVAFPGTVATDRQTLTGATVGGGLEYAITNNVSLGIEGRYTWYDTHNFNTGALATIGLPPAGPFTFAPTTTNVKLNTAEV